MRIACLGGGPAGLYFAISMKPRIPLADIETVERNKHDDTLGWGVVFSDETMHNLATNTPRRPGPSKRTSPIGRTSRSTIAARHMSHQAMAFAGQGVKKTAPVAPGSCQGARYRSAV